MKTCFLKIFLITALLILLLPAILIHSYSIINPISTLMIKDTLTFNSYERTWIPLNEISPHAIRSVMMSEDARHCAHNGVDWREMKKAWISIQNGGKGRGASTLTMQVVKNLFLWNNRSYIRKALEIPLALYMGQVLSKARILEIYLNIAEWDKGIYGIEAASQHYFNKSTKNLSPQQAALLAVTLPNPIARTPHKPGRRMEKLSNTIIARARSAGPYSQCL